MGAIDKKRTQLGVVVVPRPLREELADRRTTPKRAELLETLLRRTNMLASTIFCNDFGEFSSEWKIDETHRGRLTFEIRRGDKEEHL